MQRVPDHSITPPLTHISLGGDFPSHGVHLLPIEKFILFFENITLQGGMPLFLIEKFFPHFVETTHPRECPLSLSRNSFYSLWNPLLRERPFFPLRSSFHSLGQPLPQGMPLLPAKKCLSLLKGATPWGMPLFPLKSSFHFSGEPFHGECPFSLREPLHGNPRPYPSKCISFMLRGASASWAYRSLQVKNIFMGESNMWVSLKVFHVSSRYLCFLRLTWGD